MIRASSAWGAALVVLFVAATAAAQGADERARLHFDSGNAYYEAGDYEDALREFENAYELSHRPALLYNLYLCHERLANLDQAIAALEQYLSEGEPGERRELLETRLGNLRERAARGGSEIEPDTQPEPEADPGAPTEGGSPQVAPATEPQRDEASSGGGIPTPAIIALGAAGVGALTWAIFGILAASENGSLTDDCATRVCTEDDVSSLRTFNIVADIGFAVTIAGALATTLLWLLMGGDDDDESSAAVAPYLNESGGGVVATGRL